MEDACDDVKGGRLNVEDVKASRTDEVEFMTNRDIWAEYDEEELAQALARHYTVRQQAYSSC